MSSRIANDAPERSPGAAIFEVPATLPRGPHGLSREEVAASQRARLLAAFTELLAERGYAAVRIGDLAARAAVSRAAFYEHFQDKEACLMAAYEHFATRLLGAMAAEADAHTSWSDFVGRTLSGYLGTLEHNPIAARAFIVEMDAAGPTARRRRRDAVRAFAALFAHQHAEARAADPSLGPLPDSVYLAISLAVRELVRERLAEEAAPRLTDLTPDIVLFATAVVEGAAAAARA